MPVTEEARKYTLNPINRPKKRVEPDGRQNEEIEVMDEFGKKTHYCCHAEPRTTCYTCYLIWYDWTD